MRTPPLTIIGSFVAILGCAPAERRAPAADDVPVGVVAARDGVEPVVAPGVAPQFTPGADLDDPATATLDRYLSLSLAGADTPDIVPAALDTLLGCDMGRDPYQPVELLAGYEISGRSMRADTAVIRARVVTVAEVVAGADDMGRLTGTQRVRRGEWEWDVVRVDGRWEVCNGPLYAFPVGDAGIDWRTPGASTTSARMLADSIRQHPGTTSRSSSPPRRP